MYPSEHVIVLPEQLNLYSRGTQGTGALPTAGQAITLRIFSVAARGREDHINSVDGSIKAQTITTTGGAHRIQRFVGLWILDVFLFQDVSATLELRERTIDLNTQAIQGLADTTRSVWVRRVRPNIPFRATWRLCNAEARINYVNGGTNTTVFDLNVQARTV